MMNKVIRSVLIILSVLLIVSCQKGEDIVFKNVNLIPMTEEKVVTTSVLVSNGKIKSIGNIKDFNITSNTKVINGKGKYLTHGFADMHTHIYSKEDLDLHLANGVTLIRNMHGVPEHVNLRDKINKGKIIGPKMYTSGPIIDGRNPINPGSLRLYKVEDVEPFIKQIKKDGFDFVKVYSMLSQKTFDEIIRVSKELDIPVVGHSPIMVGVDGVMNAGQKSIEHFNGYELYKNELNWIQGKIDLTIRSGVWNCPTLLMMKQNENIVELRKSDYQNSQYVDHVLRGQWLTFPQVPIYDFERSKKLLKYLYDNGGNIVSGSDSTMPYNVAGFSLHEEFELMSDAGLTPYEILVTTTVNPAKMLNISDKSGTVEVGKDASLVLLNNNPLEDIRNTRTIEGVYNNGQWFSKAVLDNMLKSVEKKAENKSLTNIFRF